MSIQFLCFRELSTPISLSEKTIYSLSTQIQKLGQKLYISILKAVDLKDSKM